MSSEEPQVITASKFQVPKPLIALIGAILAVVLGFILFRSTSPKPTPVTDQPTPTLTPSKTTVICPVAGFCQKAKPVVNNGNTIAISSNMPTNTPIYAVFDGKTVTRSVSTAGTPRETFYSVSLVDEAQNLKAVYYFKNKINVKENLKSGEILASASATPMKFFDNNNFAFSLLDKENQIIPIEKIEFR